MSHNLRIEGKEQCVGVVSETVTKAIEKCQEFLIGLLTGQHKQGHKKSGEVFRPLQVVHMLLGSISIIGSRRTFCCIACFNA